MNKLFLSMTFRVFIFLLLVVEPPAVIAQSCYEGLLNVAKKQYESGKYEEAIKNLNSAKKICSDANTQVLDEWISKANKRINEKENNLNKNNKESVIEQMDMAAYMILGAYSGHSQTISQARTDLNRFFSSDDISRFDNLRLKKNQLDYLDFDRLHVIYINASTQVYNGNKSFGGSIWLSGFTIITPDSGTIILSVFENRLKGILKSLKDGDRVVLRNFQINKKITYDKRDLRFSLKDYESKVNDMVFEFTIDEKDTDKDGLIDDLDKCPTENGPNCNDGCPLNEKNDLTSKIQIIKIRENSYKTVAIGSQIWMVENLNVTFFRNGDPIQEAKTAEEWQTAFKLGKPAWCNYNNDAELGKKHGKIYNPFAINDPRGLAMDGWHIPGIGEWELMIKFLGGPSRAGGKLKDKQYWNTPCANSSGFTGLYSGFRARDGRFFNLGEGGYWSSSRKIGKTGITSFYMGNYYPEEIASETSDGGYGLYVRCVKD